MARQAEATVQFYQEKLEANSQSLVFSRLADCYRKKGEIQEAIGVCMNGLQIHPDYVTGRVILGRCYLEQEKLKEAIAEFTRVVELDRRNHVAIKMIADIYARQGMKEKAGDLYACLLRMDPGNQSLAKLADSNQGNGDVNIRNILGIHSAPSGGRAAEGPERQPQQSLSGDILDSDKTMQMDFVSKQPEGRLNDTSELGEMLVKTQKFDTEELNAVVDTGDSYKVEETVADRNTQGSDHITGDDITSRMSMIFGDERGPKADAAPAAESPAEAMDVVPDMADDSALRVTDDTVAAGPLDGKESVAVPVVSGSDVTSRIEQLFGDEQPRPKTDFGEEAVSDFTQAYVPGPVAEEAAVSVSVSPAPQPEELPRDEGKPAESGNISGKDVTDRLNEMFSDSSSIAEPLAEIGKLLDMHMPAVDEAEQEPPQSEMPHDVPSESIDVGPDSSGAPSLDEQDILPGQPSAVISGEDVALRLETIFDDAEKPEGSANGGANALGEEFGASSARPEEETKPPVDAEDQAIVIGGDSTENDIHEQGEATLFGAETPDETGPERIEVAPADEAFTAETDTDAGIDDAVEQEARPEMSGDDVVGRLEELFSGDLSKESGLDSVPDGDKDERDVNQGFYTMSGEDAVNSTAEDSLLSELDNTEVEADSSEEMPEPEDKTILMERDDADRTLAVAEDETILSEKPLPEQPRMLEPGEGDSPDENEVDVQIREASQIRLPSSDELASGDADTVTQYSIPNHVLTPTLADIYFQQGQPKLALQIYNRLLEADPDNEKIANRIKEIEQVCAAQETAETAMVGAEKKKPGHESIKQPPEQKKKEGGRHKPLAGVRIKKIYKSRIKKSK